MIDAEKFDVLSVDQVRLVLNLHVLESDLVQDIFFIGKGKKKIV